MSVLVVREVVVRVRRRNFQKTMLSFVRLIWGRRVLGLGLVACGSGSTSPATHDALADSLLRVDGSANFLLAADGTTTSVAESTSGDDPAGAGWSSGGPLSGGDGFRPCFCASARCTRRKFCQQRIAIIRIEGPMVLLCG